MTLLLPPSPPHLPRLPYSTDPTLSTFRPLFDVRTSHLCQGDRQTLGCLSSPNICQLTQQHPLLPSACVGRRAGVFQLGTLTWKMGTSLYTIPGFKGASSAGPGAAPGQAQQQRRGRLEAPSSSFSPTPDPQASPARSDVDGRPTHNLLG